MTNDQHLTIRPFKPFIPEKRLADRPELILDRPLDLEIGCGAGYHPIQYALNHPHRNLIAIEKTVRKFTKFLVHFRKYPRLYNLYPIHANAISWIAKHIAPEEVEHCFIFYPNPYPKTRHHNQRWYAMPFMGFLLSRLKSHGTITLATNILDYWQEAQKYFTQVWHLEIVSSSILSAEFIPRTHFEKKYLSRGEVCYNLIVKKS